MSSVRFVGGTDRAIVVVCKETLLRSRNLRHIIDSYSPIPLLARIHPSVITALANHWNEKAVLNLTYSVLPEQKLPQALSALSVDEAHLSIPTQITKEEQITSFLHSSLSSPSTFHVLASSLYTEDDQSFLQGSPRIALNNIIALLKSSVVERVDLKPSLSLASLREDAHGSRCLPFASLARTSQRAHASIHD